ncbi:unnamed protein product, partial [Rotaria magnacalcarata]
MIGDGAGFVGGCTS